MFYSGSEEKIIALLIDGDNVSSDYIDAIEQEASIMGRITHKRLYYTYNDGIPHGWVSKLNPHSLRPVQVMPYKNKQNETVKNVADAALIVDAMDIMYQGTVNTVFIVASDSDYTVLVKRLKENGIYVIGAGEAKTPHAFVKACNEFKYLEDLNGGATGSGSQSETAQSKTAEEKSKPKAKQTASAEKPKKNTAAQAEKRAAAPAPAETKNTDGEDDEKIVIPKKDIETYIIKIFENSSKNVLDSGHIMKTVKGQFPAFDWKNYPGVTRSYDFYDPKIFTVIQPTDDVHTNINVMYPAQKKK